MKKSNVILNIMLAGIFASAVLSGCGKKETTPDNHFVYNDTTYTLSQGLIYTNNVADSFYVHFVYMLSDGFTVVWKTDNPLAVDSLAGRGEMIAFTLIDKSENGPEDGTYEAMISSVKGAVVPVAFTWGIGMALIDYSEIGDEELGERVELSKGTVKVKNNGNKQLELTIDVSTNKNNSLKGFFKGSFKPFVMDNKKSLDTGFPLRLQ